MNDRKELIKGRGAQFDPKNRFHKGQRTAEYVEALDENPDDQPVGATIYIEGYPKTIVNKVNSPDIGPNFSLNPYQGCEHGCIYCYARNAHEYWGFSAGLDFERKIIVKKNAAELLEKFLRKKGHKPVAIMLSGNTDCYQPIERKLKITRGLLEVFQQFNHPVGMITKNYGITRDLDILKDLADKRLIHVAISVTTLNLETHHKLEPRTSIPKKRLKAIEELSRVGVPVRVMVAPIIPGLTDKEVPTILKASADAGAVAASFTLVRLNGAIGGIFTDWVHKQYPLKADKVLSAIRQIHQGKLYDSRYGKRTRGDGNLAQIIHQLFHIHRDKYFAGREVPKYDYSLFKVPPSDGQMELF